MWNIGTTGRMASWGERESTDGMQADIELSTMARFEYITPLGLPVVPEV